MITTEKWQQLEAWMQTLGIEEADLQEKFIIGSGSGGQKLHKTASCVYLQHVPTGLEVKCQETRSRETNRYRARQRLCEKLEELFAAEQSKREQRLEKIRRQKRRRSRRAKEKMLANKHHRSAIKAQRQKPE